jgi:hypothetical protein
MLKIPPSHPQINMSYSGASLYKQRLETSNSHTMGFQSYELRYMLYKCPVNKLAGHLVYDSDIRGLLLGMRLVWLRKKSHALSKNVAQVPGTNREMGKDKNFRARMLNPTC